MHQPNIVVFSATSNEVQLLQEYFANNPLVQIVQTGIGILSATFAMTQYLHKNKVEHAMQVGIAGSFTNLPLGSVVAVDKEFVADLGVEENGSFVDIFDLQLENENTFPYTNKAIINTYIEQFNVKNIATVTGVTVNEISTNIKRIQHIQQTYHAVIETMEGAAFYYTASQFNIPFLQLRGISNRVGERSKNNWNFKDSIVNVNDTAIKIINSLIQ